MGDRRIYFNHVEGDKNLISVCVLLYIIKRNYIYIAGNMLFQTSHLQTIKYHYMQINVADTR